MPPRLLEALEQLAAKRGQRDPNVILAIDEDRRRVQRKRAIPYYLREVK